MDETDARPPRRRLTLRTRILAVAVLSPLLAAGAWGATFLQRLPEAEPRPKPTAASLKERLLEIDGVMMAQPAEIDLAPLVLTIDDAPETDRVELVREVLDASANEDATGLVLQVVNGAVLRDGGAMTWMWDDEPFDADVIARDAALWDELAEVAPAGWLSIERVEQLRISGTAASRADGTVPSSDEMQQAWERVLDQHGVEAVTEVMTW